MSTLSLDGKPLAQFYIRDLQSWNEVFGKGHWSRKGRVVRRWRSKGYAMALRWRVKNHLPSVQVNRVKDNKVVSSYLEPIAIKTRVLVVVKVVRGTERRYDVHNVFVKALLDGFNDAGLWVDDEWAYVPTVLFTWAADTQGRGQHFVIEIHELDKYTVNGMAQILPEGREDDERGRSAKASGPAREGSDSWDWS